ncbi:hypothetical protein [Streptomyces sp. enrichment culture]|uniref:hypothetical protein n=1 Tax=Streptomyces sp. enrichment culture TaxID=1795815 RepID=UPI003F57A37C
MLYEDGSWGDPVDVVIDGRGGQLLGPAVRALAPGGRWSPSVRVAARSRRTSCSSAAPRSSASRWRPSPGTDPGRTRAGAPSRGDFTATTRCAPGFFADIPLAEAARAHEITESRGNLGKVVLIP